MFSLLITVVAVVLVACLALATIYYGGAALNRSSTNAQATQLVVQGQQILGAVELFYTDNARYPTDLDELVSTQYLSSVPQGFSGTPAGAEGWLTPASSVPTYELNAPVPDAVCEQLNQLSLGTNGIASQAYDSYSSQCYHSATSQTNTVVVTMLGTAGGTIASALPVQDVAPPTVTAPWVGGDPVGWYVPPTIAVAAPPSAAPGTLSLSASSLTLASNMQGVQGAASPVILTNNTAVTIDLWNATWNTSGNWQASFNESDSCGQLLAPGQSCTMYFSAQSPTVGPATGTFSISQGSISSNTLTVTATTTPGTFMFSQSDLVISPVAAGMAGPPGTVMLVNYSPVDINLDTATVTSTGDIQEFSPLTGILHPGDSTPLVFGSPSLTPGTLSGTFTVTQGPYTATLHLSQQILPNPNLYSLDMSLAAGYGGHQSAAVGATGVLVINWKNDTGSPITLMQLDWDWWATGASYGSLGTCANVSSSNPLLPNQSCYTTYMLNNFVDMSHPIDYQFADGRWHFAGSYINVN